MLIEEVDFISFVKWMWNRHEDQMLSLSQLCDCADTYCGITYGETPKDKTNVEMIEAMVDIGLIIKTPKWNGFGYMLKVDGLI